MAKSCGFQDELPISHAFCIRSICGAQSQVRMQHGQTGARTLDASSLSANAVYVRYE